MAAFFARRESRESAEDSTWTAIGASRRSRLSHLSALPRSTTLVSALKSARQGTLDGHAEDAARAAGELLAEIAHRRDRSAFATLFSFYAPRLTSHLLARGADSGTAEEIVQDVMLTVWRKAEQFDATRGSASTWIYTLARNAFIDRVRREHRPEVDPTDPLLGATDPGANPGADPGAFPGADRLMLDAESQRELAAAVESLPAEQREVVRRSYFHGQSLSQISAAAGLPLGTVKTRARLALSHLRALVTHRRET